MIRFVQKNTLLRRRSRRGGPRAASTEGGDVTVGTAAVNDRSSVLASLLGSFSILKSNLLRTKTKNKIKRRGIGRNQE